MRMMFLLITMFMLSVNHVHAQADQQRSEFMSVYEGLHRSRYALLPHKSSYLLPYVYNWTPHENIYEPLKPGNKKNKGDFYKRTEAEFQFSFAIPVMREMKERKWDILLAYTHHSYWQLYNYNWSRPFRETNYMPEVFGRYFDESEQKFLGFDLRALDGGFVHQSNGQIPALSRSWDRLFIRSYLQHKYFNMIVTGWYRLPEDRDDDQNIGIYNYMGIGDLELIKDFGKHRAYVKVPILSHHLNSYDLKYSLPLRPGLRWYLSYQSGYGHSLIEYNRYTQRAAVGFQLEHFIF